MAFWLIQPGFAAVVPRAHGTPEPAREDAPNLLKGLQNRLSCDQAPHHQSSYRVEPVTQRLLRDGAEA